MRILTAPIFTVPVAMPFAPRRVAALAAAALAPSALAVPLAAADATALAAALTPSALAAPKMRQLILPLVFILGRSTVIS